MPKKWVHIFAQYLERKSRRKKELKEDSISLDISVQLKNIAIKDATVRIIHAGGREELYQNGISASQVMKKYPGTCVALPEVFHKPHESFLSAEDNLLPGRKYYIIPSTTAKKLKRKHSEEGKVEELDDFKEALRDLKAVADIGGELSDESFCYAKDFYVSKDKWSRCALQKCQKGKKPFVPPIQKPMMWKRLDWEPSLPSIQELSP